MFQKSSNVLRISSNTTSEIVLLPISWSHYLFLMRIENENERQFYEIEAEKQNWSEVQLKRQLFEIFE